MPISNIPKVSYKNDDSDHKFPVVKKVESPSRYGFKSLRILAPILKNIDFKKTLSSEEAPEQKTHFCVEIKHIYESIEKWNYEVSTHKVLNYIEKAANLFKQTLKIENAIPIKDIRSQLYAGGNVNKEESASVLDTLKLNEPLAVPDFFEAPNEEVRKSTLSEAEAVPWKKMDVRGQEIYFSKIFINEDPSSIVPPTCIVYFPQKKGDEPTQFVPQIAFLEQKTGQWKLKEYNVLSDEGALIFTEEDIYGKETKNFSGIPLPADIQLALHFFRSEQGNVKKLTEESLRDLYVEVPTIIGQYQEFYFESVKKDEKMKVVDANGQMLSEFRPNFAATEHYELANGQIGLSLVLSENRQVQYLFASWPNNQGGLVISTLDISYIGKEQEMTSNGFQKIQIEYKDRLRQFAAESMAAWVLEKQKGA